MKYLRKITTTAVDTGKQIVIDETMIPKTEWCAKVILIDPQFLCDFINGMADKTFLMLPECEALPSGTKVTRIWFDQSWRELKAIVEHPSFEAVPSGEPAPNDRTMMPIEFKAWRRKPIADEFELSDRLTQKPFASGLIEPAMSEAAIAELKASVESASPSDYHILPDGTQLPKTLFGLPLVIDEEALRQDQSTPADDVRAASDWARGQLGI